MDEAAFRLFLKRRGRAPHVVQDVVALVQRFAGCLQEQRGKALDEAAPEDLAAYVAWLEETTGKSAKGHLHAIAYYCEFAGNKAVRAAAGRLRQERIARAAFPLKSFRGVRPEHLRALAAAGIRSAEQMLQAGRLEKLFRERCARYGIATRITPYTPQAAKQLPLL